MQKELRFLGHVVSEEGIRADPQKVSAVADWPQPQDVRQVRQFLGLANYFRRFIQGYARMSRPMTALLKKNTEFLWSEEVDACFREIKRTLSEAPCLALPNPARPFVVISDASGFALGGVLLQDGRPIAYESRQLTPAEKNYDAGERELLAVCYLLEKWRCYLQGPKFVVETDHCPLTYLNTQVRLARKRVRYADILS